MPPPGSLAGMYPLFFRTVLSRLDPEFAHHAAMLVIRIAGVPPFSWAARGLTRPAPELRTEALFVQGVPILGEAGLPRGG